MKKNLSKVCRVEMELHAVWLRESRIRTMDGLSHLADLLPRKELRFVLIDLKALERQLRRSGLPVEKNLRRAQELPDGLHAELVRWRQQLGLRNTHRLLVGLQTNVRVERALRTWVKDWMAPVETDD
jgi:hypothetical protein